MRKQQNIILAAIISLTLLADPALAQSLVGKVVSVADGDTITILDGDRTQHKIRLSGIDAPERSQALGGSLGNTWPAWLLAKRLQSRQTRRIASAEASAKSFFTGATST